MKPRDDLRLRGYVARLNMVICGCGSATCPFRPEYRDDLVGTANLCQCGQVAYDLSKAIYDAVTEAHIVEAQDAPNDQVEFQEGSAAE